MRRPGLLTLGVVAVVLSAPAARAGLDVAASKTLTVQETGPRAGDAGSRYFNIEGKEQGKYASYGVLVFSLPKQDRSVASASVSLSLTQSVTKFANDGPVTFVLVPGLDVGPDLKFRTGQADGLNDAIKPRHPLGSGRFEKRETGQVDTFTLKPDTPAMKEILARLAAGGDLVVVVLPGDSAVAATYFGVAAEPDQRPKLTIELKAKP